MNQDPKHMEPKSTVISPAKNVAVNIDSLRQRSVLFSVLSDEDANAIIQLGSIVQHPAKHIVFQIGETGDHLFILLEGRVKVSEVIRPPAARRPEETRSVVPAMKKRNAARRKTD